MATHTVLNIHPFSISCCNSIFPKSRVYNSVLNTYIFWNGVREALGCDMLSFDKKRANMCKEAPLLI